LSFRRLAFFTVQSYHVTVTEEAPSKVNIFATKNGEGYGIITIGEVCDRDELSLYTQEHN